MSILKDISAVSQTVAEARRATKFFAEMWDWKKKLQAATIELNMERKAKENLIKAIKEHQKEMAECPRSWEQDKALWKAAEFYSDK